MSNPASTVYFRGFPEEIPNEELENLFAQYGNIVKCFIHKSRTYGMVEFDEVSSCSEAISALNGVPPLNLYLNMAKTQPIDKSMNDKRSSGNRFINHAVVDVPVVTYEEKEFFFDENNVAIDVLIDPITNETYVPIRYAQNIRRYVKKVPVPVDNGFHRNGNLSDDDTSSVFTTSSNIPNRRVKYNHSNTPNIKIERSFNEDDIPRSISNRGNNRGGKRSPFNNRMSIDGSNFNKNDETKTGFVNRIPNDSIDGAGASNFNHKKDDLPKPSFGNRFSNDGSNKKEFGNRFPTDVRPIDGGNKTDEAPKPFNRRDQDKPRFNKKNQGGAGDNQPQKFPKKEFNKSRAPEKDDDDWGASAVVAESLTSNASTPAVPKQIFNNFKAKTNKVLYKTIELPKNKYTQVRIEHTVNESLGFAQISDKEEEFEAFMLTVIEQTFESPIPTTPEVGKICLAKFDDVWFRAIVLTIFPKITVRFIDYGNESVVKGDVLEISPEARDVPAYAVCINLADGAPCKIRNLLIIKVKPVKIEKDVVVVHVENGIYDKQEPEVQASAPSPVASTSAIQTIANSSTYSSSVNSLSGCQETMMAKLKANISGMFEATTKLSSTKTVAFFLPELLGEDAGLLENISKIVESANCASFRPKVGDLVSAPNEGWNRALILKIENGFKVAFIDFGTIKTVSAVKPLPDDFKNIPQFSCVVTASEKDLNKINENNDGLSFKITKIINKTVHCTLFTGEADLCEVTFVLWNPAEETTTSRPYGKLSKMLSTSGSSLETVKQVLPKTRNKLEPPELKLKNGDDVKLIDESKGYLFVRTKEASDILKRVDKSISEYAPKAPKIVEKPTVGQYVAAQYDNVWYRAKVTNVKENSADILYIDYGNEELKPFFSLKQLNEKICEEPCTLIKIKLKGFVEKPFTDKCLTYFASLSESNQILKATFQGSEENGVDLTMKDGKNVTEELIKLDAPKPKPFPTRKELYMKVKVPGQNDERIMALGLEEIPFGKTEIKYLCDITFEFNSICVSLNKPELLHKIQVELLDQMTKYVNHIAPKQPYSPIREEVVLVENKDKWYRAICLEPEEKEGIIVVFFVDYGFNLGVTADKIRRIPQEFVTDEHRALGIFANIYGLPEVLNDNVIDRLETLMCKNETYQVDVKSKDAEGNYAIDFPEILQQLKSENLI